MYRDSKWIDKNLKPEVLILKLVDLSLWKLIKQQIKRNPKKRKKVYKLIFLLSFIYFNLPNQIIKKKIDFLTWLFRAPLSRWPFWVFFFGFFGGIILLIIAYYEWKITYIPGAIATVVLCVFGCYHFRILLALREVQFKRFSTVYVHQTIFPERMCDTIGSKQI